MGADSGESGDRRDIGDSEESEDRRDTWDTTEITDSGESEEQPVTYDVSSSERTWAILVHASAFIGMVIPMGHFIGPLVIWLVKKDESEFIDANGRESVNFQLSMTIYVVVAAILVVVLIGIFILPLLLLAWFVLVVIASIRASNDQVYRYPGTMRLIS